MNILKFYKILIASLLLVILTLGVVNASDENAAVDNLAMDENIQVNVVENQVDGFSNLSDEINDVEPDGTLNFK